jgi:hypothetical protein
LGSAAPVKGLVLPPRANQDSIARRSYVCPSAHTTGSVADVRLDYSYTKQLLSHRAAPIRTPGLLKLANICLPVSTHDGIRYLTRRRSQGERVCRWSRLFCKACSVLLRGLVHCMRSSFRPWKREEYLGSEGSPKQMAIRNTRIDSYVCMYMCVYVCVCKYKYTHTHTHT